MTLPRDLIVTIHRPSKLPPRDPAVTFPESPVSVRNARYVSPHHSEETGR